MSIHNSFVENNRKNGDSIKIIFTGSSLVQCRADEGLEVWKRKYAPLGAFNYGIGGDQIQHVLWRVSNGELDGISPKLVLVYAGSNNITTSHTAEEIVKGISAVISKIREKLPNTRILYMSIFPREEEDPDENEAAWAKITAVNQAVEKLNDGNMVNVLSTFSDLAASWGIVKGNLYLQDKVHFSKEGYKQREASMSDTFNRLLNL
jgi:lysophospholipase L1-like esterase